MAAWWLVLRDHSCMWSLVRGHLLLRTASNKPSETGEETKLYVTAGSPLLSTSTWESQKTQEDISGEKVDLLKIGKWQVTLLRCCVGHDWNAKTCESPGRWREGGEREVLLVWGVPRTPKDSTAGGPSCTLIELLERQLEKRQVDPTTMIKSLVLPCEWWKPLPVSEQCLSPSSVAAESLRWGKNNAKRFIWAHGSGGWQGRGICVASGESHTCWVVAGSGIARYMCTRDNAQGGGGRITLHPPTLASIPLLTQCSLKGPMPCKMSHWDNFATWVFVGTNYLQEIADGLMQSIFRGETVAVI